MYGSQETDLMVEYYDQAFGITGQPSNPNTFTLGSSLSINSANNPTAQLEDCAGCG